MASDSVTNSTPAIAAWEAAVLAAGGAPERVAMIERELRSAVAPRPWFLATCLDCEPILPQPFSDPAERDAWAIAHRVGMGHTVANTTKERS